MLVLAEFKIGHDTCIKMSKMYFRILNHISVWPEGYALFSDPHLCF